MKKAILLAVLIFSGCNNSAENKKNFEACVARAEMKYQQAFSAICIHRSYDKEGYCSYSVLDKSSLERSKDNEITACAQMYAPK